MLLDLFSRKPAADFSRLLAEGAAVLDVRTPAEFASGHLAGSTNIPLDQLASRLDALPAGRPIITCCRSGARSGVAVDILKRHGIEAFNGGSWTSLKDQVKR
jgi:phage shock protein E